MITQAIIIFLCLTTSLAAANDRESVPSKKELPSTEISTYSQSYYNAAIIFTATVLTGVGLIALTAFFFPVMAYKVCYSLGGCQNTMDAYVDELIGKELGKARNIRSRNKRSMEYIEPILVTLAKAYEEYGDQDVKKNFKIPNYYTK